MSNTRALPRILIISQENENAGVIGNAANMLGYPWYDVGFDKTDVINSISSDTGAIIIDGTCDYTSALGLCAQIRTMELFSSLPVFIIINQQDSDPGRAYEAGATDYLCSPFNPSELRIRMQAAFIGNNQYEDSLLAPRDEVYQYYGNLLLHRSPLFFIAINAEGRVIMMNETMLQALGYSNEEVIGLDYLSVFIPSENQIELAEVFRLLAEEHQTTFNENWIISRNGKRILVEWHGVPIFHHGVFQHYIGIGLDITERSRWEKALVESEEKYRSLVDNLNIGIYQSTLDRAGRFLSVNHAMADIFGYDSVQELSAIHPEQLYEKREDREVFLRQLKNHGYVRNAELRMRRKDGRAIWASVSAIAHVNQDDAVGWMDGAVEDITERKSIEASLQHTNMILETEQNASPDGILVVDLKGRILLCNPRFVEIWGIKPTVASKSSGRSIVSEIISRVEEPSDLMRKIDYLIKNPGESSSFELKNSDDRILECLSAPIQGDDRMFYGRVWYFRDVTDRKKAEKLLRERNEQLQESEEKYRLLFERSMDAMLIIEDGQFVDCNLAALSMLGYTVKSDLLRLHPAQLSPLVQPDGRFSYEKAEEILETAYKESSLRFEWVHTKADGAHIWVDVCLTAINLQGKRLLHTSWRDISQRKQAEEEIRDLNTYLESSFDSMPSIQAGLDARGRIRYWNREAERLTGMQRGQVIGENPGIAFQKWPVIAQEIENALREQAVKKVERIPQILSDETRFFSMIVYPLKSNSLLGTVIHIDDITEQVRLQDTIIQNEKLVTIGGLAAGMAHEINNPLGGILQGAQNISRRFSTDLDINWKAAREVGIDLDQMRAYLEKRHILEMLEGVRRAGEKASAIVTNMLQFSRAGRGQKAETDLNSVVRHAIDLIANDYDLQRGYDVKQFAFDLRLDDDVPMVFCIEVEIEQVIINLLRNAVQAATGYASKPMISVATYHEGGRAVCEVRDNGPGMTEDIRSRVFEPFFTTKEKGQGTGLGLSVSHYIITSHHGGEMTVTSQPGQGAAFKIKLPLGEQASDS